MILSRNVFGGRFVVQAASFGGAYDATVRGIPNLLAYWRFNTAASIVDAVGGRHGTFDAPVTLIGGLPQGSDQAVRLGGAARGTVPTDSGLDRSAFTLSLWVILHEDPEDLRAILAREQSGFNAGDFGLYYQSGEFFRAQFQTASGSVQINGSLPIGEPAHIVVTADGAGFALWVNGQLQGTSAGFTGAWSNNGNDIVFGSAQQLTAELDITIDEVAIYTRVLTTAEILTLGQRTSLPVAANLSGFTVDDDGGTVTINVAGSSTFVGAKADLIITLGEDAEFGEATVEPNNDITYTADDVLENQADSFTYTIEDANGESAPATISLTVIDAGEENPGGGTLVYDFQPQASWIDDGSMTVAGSNKVPLASRDNNDVIGLQASTPFDPTKEPTPNRWKLSTANGGGVLTGAALVKGTNNKGAQSTATCWNRAPDGTPSLELYTTAGQHNVVDFAIRLYPALLGTGARHLRVVMDLWLCDSGDPMTYKSQGQGPTTGAYPNYQTCIEGSTQYCWSCIFQGIRQEGPIFCGRWGDPSLTITQIGHLISGSGSTGNRGHYVADFGRSTSGTYHSTNLVKLADCYGGQWHRTELEIKLTNPSLVPEDARRADPVIDPNPHNGDGEAKLYLTPDVDGILGPAGARTVNGQTTGLLFNPKYDDTLENYDNMHTLNDLSGVYLLWYFGGSGVSQSNAWVWIRRIQVYRHD